MSEAEWEAAHRLKDEDIDYSDAPSLDSGYWVIVDDLPPKEQKTQVSLRLNKNVVDWFREYYPKYTAQMVHVLTTFMKAKLAGNARAAAIAKPKAAVNTKMPVRRKSA